METAERIAAEPRWQGEYRLTVSAPLLVLDLCWNDDQPLRIFAFSRGTWERALLA